MDFTVDTIGLLSFKHDSKVSNEYRIAERNDTPTPHSPRRQLDWTTKWTQISRVHPSQKGPGASLLVKMKKKKL